jgi:glucan biosynthesis protein C
MRYNYLDFCRTVLLGLGIVLHAAWLCKEQSHTLAHVHDFIHSFRMQSFFLLAGFFSGMSLVKDTPEQFLRKRVYRLGIPLLFCGLLINPLLNCANLQSWSDLSLQLTSEYWVSAKWLHHLWFLATLLQYVFVLFLAHCLWPRLQRSVRHHNLNLFTLCAFVTIGFFLSIHAGHAFPVLRSEGAWFFVRPTAFLYYSIYFAAGYYLFHHQNLLQDLGSNVLLNVLSILGFGLMHSSIGKIWGGVYVLQMWQGVYSLNVCGLLFWIAKEFFNKRNQLVQSFSDASYTMYLVHWPIMIVFFRFFHPSGFPVGLLFSLLVFVTGFLSFQFHALLVRRSHFLAYLFNGRRTNTPRTMSPIFKTLRRVLNAVCVKTVIKSSG